MFAHAPHQVDTNKITATDYAVYIEGLPKTAGRKEIGRFFRYCTILEAQCTATAFLAFDIKIKTSETASERKVGGPKASD